MNLRHPPLPSPASDGRTVRACPAFVAGALAAALSSASSVPAIAADLPSQAEAQLVNENTVGIVFHYEDVYRRLVADMTDEFAAESDVRIVPIIGLNHVQTLYDMLYMKGVDLGIVHADVLEYMARVRDYERVYERINGLIEISSEKVALIAGERYRSLEDLSGRKVNLGEAGKGSDVTGTILFDTVGIEVEMTGFDKLEALEKVKSGEIAAMVYLIEEPLDEFTQLSPADGVRLIGLPQTEPLLEHYRATQLSGDDFPELIEGESTVPSLEVSVIIAAYNWPESESARYEKSRRFVGALLDGLDELKGNDDSMLWKDVSLQKEIPGVERLALVDTLMEEREARKEREAAEVAAAKVASLRARQERLMTRLNEQLESDATDPAVLAELERLIEQLQTIVGD